MLLIMLASLINGRFEVCSFVLFVAAGGDHQPQKLITLRTIGYLSPVVSSRGNKNRQFSTFLDPLTSPKLIRKRREVMISLEAYVSASLVSQIQKTTLKFIAI